MKFRNKERAATLVEVIISMTITLVVVGLASEALIVASQYQQRLFRSTELELECIGALEHLIREMSESNLESVVCNGSAVVFPVPRNGAGDISLDPTTSFLTWPSLVCYRWNPGTGELERKLESFSPNPGPLQPLSMTPARDEAYYSSNLPVSRVFSNNVENFRVGFFKNDGSDPDDLPDPGTRTDADFLRIDLELRLQGSRAIGIETSMNVVPRN